jgi:hypothetical protein
MRNKKIISLLLAVALFVLLVVFLSGKGNNDSVGPDGRFWEIQSIDTVKYSRDVAREKAKDASYDKVIDTQVKLIAGAGATHLAVGTPYDEEFVSFLTRWVTSARKYGLKIWFRGNFSGWERWFNYEKISRDEHLNLLDEFIRANGELFENGDIFSSCTECENGGPGDPRRTGDAEGHRAFLIDEYKAASAAFRAVGKNVRTLFPMNGDVARLVMNEQTTAALGGIVVIDHYVRNPERLSQDIVSLAKQSEGKVVLGEFGAPIPDIHGTFTQSQQAEWVDGALAEISKNPKLIGVNYWTSFGSSTNIWNADGTSREVAAVIAKYYSPSVVSATVKDEAGQAIEAARVTLGPRSTLTDKSGGFLMPVVESDSLLEIKAAGYEDKEVSLAAGQKTTVHLTKVDENLLFRIRKLIYLSFSK